MVSNKMNTTRSRQDIEDQFSAQLISELEDYCAYVGGSLQLSRKDSAIKLVDEISRHLPCSESVAVVPVRKSESGDASLPAKLVKNNPQVRLPAHEEFEYFDSETQVMSNYNKFTLLDGLLYKEQKLVLHEKVDDFLRNLHQHGHGGINDRC
jgi:hypothetical protein